MNGVLLWTAVTVLTLFGRPLLAAGVGVVGVAMIALRGYLVPFTPQFAPQLVSLLPGDPFDHDRAPGSLSETVSRSDENADEDEDEETVSALLEAGVLVSDRTGGDPAVEPATRRAWRTTMANLRAADIDDLAALADEVTPDSIAASGETRWGKAAVVLEPEAETEPAILLPRAIAVAELAAVRALEFAPNSEPLDDDLRLAACRPFRRLLEACPLCEGELTVSTSACCGDIRPAGSSATDKLVCPACSVRVYTYENEDEVDAEDEGDRTDESGGERDGEGENDRSPFRTGGPNPPASDAEGQSS